MVRTAGGADDAASPGPMRRAGGGGRHDRPFDTVSIRVPTGHRQSNRRPEMPGQDSGAASIATPQRMSRSEASKRSSPNASSTWPGGSSRPRWWAPGPGAAPARPVARRAASAARLAEISARRKACTTRPSTCAGSYGSTPASIAATEVAVPATATAAAHALAHVRGDGRLERRRARRARGRPCSSRAGGSSREVALGVAHDARLGGHVEVHLAARARDELGRAAADVDDQQRRRRRRGRGPPWRRGRSGAPPRRRSACARRARSGRAPSRRTPAPLAASRTADVITARRRSQPWRSIDSA